VVDQVRSDCRRRRNTADETIPSVNKHGTHYLYVVTHGWESIAPAFARDAVMFAMNVGKHNSNAIEEHANLLPNRLSGILIRNRNDRSLGLDISFIRLRSDFSVALAVPCPLHGSTVVSYCVASRSFQYLQEL
jgi:hypothetical protein